MIEKSDHVPGRGIEFVKALRLKGAWHILETERSPLVAMIQNRELVKIEMGLEIKAEVRSFRNIWTM